MDATEVVDVREPHAEKLIRPSLGFQHLKTENGVVVDGVDDHLHQVDAVRLSPGLPGVDGSHGHFNEERDELVNMATEIEHESLRKLASANPIHTANLVIAEDVLHHSDNGREVSRSLNQCLRTIRNVVVKGRQHV